MSGPPPIQRAQTEPGLSPRDVVASLADSFGDAVPALVLFFGGTVADFPELARRVHEQWPQTTTVGCTSAGEVGPAGIRQRGVSALALHGKARVAAALVDELDALSFDEVVSITERLGRGLRRRTLDPQRHFFLTLIDGRNADDQMLLAGIAMAAPGIPLVGGAAGDEGNFDRTLVAADGLVCENAAVLTLVEPAVRFRAFQVHHFDRTERRVVVTGNDPEQALVSELDGRSAHQVYRELYSLSDADFANHTPESRITLHPLGMQVGEDWILRSFISQPDEQLRVLGSLEAGSVLRQMKRGNLIARTRARLDMVTEEIGEVSACLMFDCIGRFNEAERSGLRSELDELYRSLGGVGFLTYGEHFGAQTLNLTLTGLVFGTEDE